MIKQYSWAHKLLNKYMYSDVATIHRQVEHIDEYGADVYEMTAIYNQIPCKLSQNDALGQSEKTDGPFLVQEKLTVLMEPGIQVLPNDRLRVHRMGEEYILYALDIFQYPTHIEVVARREEDA